MDKFLVEGGAKLRGTINVQGAKNAALPILAGALLSKGRIVLHNLPSNLLDVQQMVDLDKNAGATLFQEGKTLHIIADKVTNTNIIGGLNKLTRYSLQLATAILARLGKVRFPMPGGCVIGTRKIDLHLEALTSLGAEVIFDNNFIELIGKEMRGAFVRFRFASVGATETFLLAACTAKGKSVLENAAKEPEVVDLANFLNSIGANICGAGSSRIEVEGVDHLQEGEYRIISDRIVTATYIIAAGITQGEILVKNTDINLLDAVIIILRKIGIHIEEQEKEIYVKGPKGFNPIDIVTAPYPGFPTDVQPLIAPLLVLANGKSEITETIFDDRFGYTENLIRMGAKIELEGKREVSIFGPAMLTGTVVNANDIRAGACLVLASLAAQGETLIKNIYQIDRGYERLDSALYSLGARIERV